MKPNSLPGLKGDQTLSSRRILSTSATCSAPLRSPQTAQTICRSARSAQTSPGNWTSRARSSESSQGSCQRLTQCPGAGCHHSQAGPSASRQGLWYSAAVLGKPAGIQCGHCCGASCMPRPRLRARMRQAIRPLCWRDGRSHAKGLRTTKRIDTTIQTVIELFRERQTTPWGTVLPASFP